MTRMTFFLTPCHLCHSSTYQPIETFANGCQGQKTMANVANVAIVTESFRNGGLDRTDFVDSVDFVEEIVNFPTAISTPIRVQANYGLRTAVSFMQYGICNMQFSTTMRQQDKTPEDFSLCVHP